jgi:DNA polymerase-3 subunit epsilon
VTIEPVRWVDDRLRLLDQTALPVREVERDYTRWEDVADQPTFRDVWAAIAPMLEGTAFLAAHNASFDRNVLDACCRAAGLAPPDLPYVCTVALARRTWAIRPTKLNYVCDRLGIPLRHHDPASDAEACARIVLRAADRG